MYNVALAKRGESSTCFPSWILMHYYNAVIEHTDGQLTTTFLSRISVCLQIQKEEPVNVVGSSQMNKTELYH